MTCYLLLSFTSTPTENNSPLRGESNSIVNSANVPFIPEALTLAFLTNKIKSPSAGTFVSSSIVIELLFISVIIPIVLGGVAPSNQATQTPLFKKS